MASIISSNRNFDFVVIGAGIVGLSIARELALAKVGSVLVLEKEAHVGRHASGRNSGVIHSGLYYPSDSMKARFCIEGHRRLLEYAKEHKLPHEICGKVIVTHNPQSLPTMDMLFERGKFNGVSLEQLDEAQLKELEPRAFTVKKALWSPRTAIIDSRSVLDQLTKDLERLDVKIEFVEEVLQIDLAQQLVKTKKQNWQFGKLVNAAGAYADKVAHLFGVGKQYRILPFKGLYWQSSEDFARQIRSLIYPVPDISMPFLGVHITRTVTGKVLFGPTAIPAFGRENYSYMRGMDLRETPAITMNLLRMMATNNNNIRGYVKSEVARYIPSQFFKEASQMVHGLKKSEIAGFYKVGIRAQLMNTLERKLVMDFVVEPGPHSIHVLNAISPAFSSALAFAPHVVERLLRAA